MAPLAALLALGMLDPTQAIVMELPHLELPSVVDVSSDAPVPVDDAPHATIGFLGYAFAVHGAFPSTGDLAREIAPVAHMGIEIPLAGGLSLYRAVSVATGKASAVRDIPIPLAEGAVVGLKVTF